LKGLAAVGMLASGLAAVIAIVVAEFMNARGVERTAYYGGIAAGGVLAAVGIPFAAKLGGIGGKQDAGAAFWKWWGAGMIIRMALLLIFAFTLMALFREHPAVALLTMGGVYMAGMFAEAAWVAKTLFKMNSSTPKDTGSK
jgi:hypothetical protein